ncbi:HAD-IA family hydrolase [Arthrobacter alpinus]|uniref:HAD family hydrolase n=1 Tax=Arthrobacter alpinus TaxID=656366 RepID=UPI002FFC2EE0
MPSSGLHRAIGMGGDELVRHFLGEVSDGQVEKLKSSHDAIFSTHWPALVAFHGAKDLLIRCSEAGLGVVLASSAKEEELEVLRKVMDADAVISAATSSSDAELGKPAPDIIAAALEAAGVDADHAVFVGDAVWDASASEKLGVPMIGVSSGGTSAGELLEAGAVEVYRDVQALLDSFDASALGQLISRTLRP